MAKKISSKQKKEELNKLFAKYNVRLGMLYSTFVKKLTALGYGEDVLEGDALFNFDNFPELKVRLDDIFANYFTDSVACYKQGMSDGVALAFSHDTDELSGFSVMSDKAIETLRASAAATFIASRLKTKNGLNLSQRIWNYCQQTKSEFEMAMSNVIADGIKGGTSAEELGRKIRKYLNDPDMMYRRYHTVKVLKNGKKKDVVTWRRRRVIDGKVRFVEEPLENVGTGVYRSSRMNALRVARTEINAAYLRGHNARWAKEPFVIGQWIHRSPQHEIKDICDDLEGEYPKDFVFSNWHPNCYAEGTQVLTKRGWKLFSEVDECDEILSLNPHTRETEYTSIEQIQKYPYKGELIHFHNKFLDCLVTPEHQMVYLDNSDKHCLKKCPAIEYTKGKGAFYRTAENNTEDRSEIWFGDRNIPFDLYCEFMGYYLADGSMQRDHGVTLCQKKGEPAWEKMQECIVKLGFVPHVYKETIVMYHRAFGRYLLQFGKSYNKFIPDEILNASKRQIQIFLDAFILCDGSKRKPKIFVGNRGNVFIGKKEERIYYTTSVQMAADFAVLLLRIGHRPSYRIQECNTTVKKDGSIISSKHPCYRINECYSATSTVFDKDTEWYDGYVYDLTLQKNHIMYIQKDGKCFWGSNCMCTADPIMIEGEEKKQFYDRLYAGEDMSGYVSPNAIDDVPKQYRQYITDHESKIVAAFKSDKLAWHLADNKQYWQKLCSKESLKAMGIETMSAKERIMQAAKKRHEQRTQEQIDHIQSRWNKHRRDYYNGLVDGVTGGKPVDSLKSKDLYERYYAIREAIKDKKSVSDVGELFERFKQGYETKLAWTDRKIAMNVMKVAQNYGETDITGVANALKSADYALAKQEAKALAKSIKAIQNDETSLSTLIPDANMWHKQFTSKQLHEVYDAVENKLAYINAKVLNTYKYKSLLEQQKALLENEIKYVANPSYLKPHNIYPTHQVAADAFKEQLNVVNYKIQIEDYLAKCEPIKAYIATHTNAKKLSELYSELISAISTKENQDILSVKFTNLEKRWQTVQKTNTTRESKRSNDTHVVFEKACFTDKRKNAALQFHNANDAEAYYLDYAKEAYKNASDTFKSAAESYTKNSSSITRLLRGIDGWMEYDIWYVKENEPYINALTDVISKSRLKDDCWIVRDERAVFFTLKTGGLDVNILNKNIDSYSMKLKQKYIQKYGRLSEKIMNEIADKVDMYTEHEARQLVGREGFDPSFCSAGTPKNWEFSGTGGDNKFDEPKVHLEIYCPKGTQALYAAPYNHYNSKVKGADGFWDGVSPTRSISEAEIFLQRNTKYKVTSANYDSVKDKWYVKVEVIEQNPIEIDGYIDVLDPVNSKKGYKPRYK